jgi:hypothetical protein
MKDKWKLKAKELRSCILLLKARKTKIKKEKKKIKNEVFFFLAKRTKVDYNCYNMQKTG